MKRYVVTLTEEEREALGALTTRGKHRSQKILNALILLDCDEGEFQTQRSTNEEIARVLNISMRKIDRVKRRFVVDGLEVCLNGRKGSCGDGKETKRLGADSGRKSLRTPFPSPLETGKTSYLHP